MTVPEETTQSPPLRVPCNEVERIAAKPPFGSKYVGSDLTLAQLEG